MSEIYIAISSAVGDRVANILSIVQKLRRHAVVLALSSIHEGAFVSDDEISSLVVSAHIRTGLTHAAFVELTEKLRTSIKRASNGRGERDVEIDLIPASQLDIGRVALRPHVVESLAEIAPQPLSQLSPEALDYVVPKHASRNGKRRLPEFQSNKQEDAPDVRLALSRVGVSRVKRIMHLNIGGEERSYNAELSMVADLAPDKAGIHMSRFSEILEEATLDVLAEQRGPTRIEDLVEAIAREILKSHRAIRADVKLRADFALERWTPVSGKRSNETYTLVGIAHADEEGSRCVVGVEAEGMTACPCAQLMIRENSVRELQQSGFDEATSARILDILPSASHNQRGRGSVLIGVDAGLGGRSISAEDLVELVENSMSSETYDLLKRPDEFFIVNKAHRNPKFVEDVVRGILSQALDMYDDLPDSTFLAATQINYESIHKHDAFAEGFGTFGEFREELRTGRYISSKTDLAAWLGARPSIILA